jgi:hypothetical protein
MLIDCTIQGITPLILDRFHNSALEGRTAARTVNGKEELTPLQQAQARLYLYEDNPKKPYLPSTYLLRAIIDAGRFIKVGKRQLSTRDETTVTSFLSVIGTDFPIKSDEGWRVDARGVVNQVTKARVMAYRPIFDHWQLSFVIDLDTKEGRIDVARELVDRAGRAIGVGVMRPSRKGPFGQFKVIRWHVREVELLEAAE